MARRFGYVTFSRIVDGCYHTFLIPEVTAETHPNHRLAASVNVAYAAKENGMPENLAAAQKLEDGILKSLESSSRVYAGHTIGAGKLTVLFRCDKTPPAEVKAKIGFLKTEVLPIEVREDPNWSWHEQFLPTDVEIHQSRNIKLLQTLKQHGDDNALPRPVDFAFHFANESDRADGLAALEALGYRLNEEGQWESDNHRFWFAVELTCPVKSGDIAERCASLSRLAEDHNGEFDGWACPVVSGA